MTNRRIWGAAASSRAQACAQIEAWTASPSIRLIGETEVFLTIVVPLVGRSRVRGGVVHDARIAAICIAHGVSNLLSRDRDFSLFPALKIDNPFA